MLARSLVDRTGTKARGVGAALTSAVVEWARTSGAKRVVLGVAEGNRAAAALFERFGFVETGKREVLRKDLVEIQYTLDLETAWSQLTKLL